MSGIDSDLIRGHIDTIILKVLFEGDKYGIEICKEVEEKSGGTYELKQPTLYSCLKRLETQGLISSYWTDSDIGGKRHYYKLTAEGKQTYKHNQEEWMRSRQIIDNLISNTYEDASSYALVKKDEIKDLEEKAEKAEQQLEELQEQVAIDVVRANNEEQLSNVVANMSIDQDEEIIPWGTAIEEKTEESEKNEELVTYSWSPVSIINETKQESALVTVAPNGEEMAAVVNPIDEQERGQDEEQTEDGVVADAQASFFEKSEDVFNDNQTDYDVLEREYLAETDNKEDESQIDEKEEDFESVDILELLGHTIKGELSSSQPELFEEVEQDVVSHQEEQIEENIEKQEEVSPFSFRMEDFVKKSQNSYFESEEVLSPTPDYVAPEMKIDGLEKSQEEQSCEETKFDDDSHADDIYQPEQDFSTPVYHDFGANFNHKIEEDDDIYECKNDDADEIYNPEQIEDNTAIVDDGLKLFGEDIFEDNEYSLETKAEYQTEASEQNGVIVREQPQEVIANPQLMDFYKSTENYEMINPKFTDEEYKEKLTTLMSYGSYEEENTPVVESNASPSPVVYDASPKDYTDLKTEFEKEGLVVRPHYKMVKESKQTRSYIEANKLNMVTAWTSFGIVACLVALTGLIMMNYSSALNYDFALEYFLIGISCLSVIPLIYTLLYFINPYKKKPARYASRISMLFAILLSVQLYIIIYCVNLQLGFYSFAQPNYNHLLWIIPSILALYPLADAVLHTVYFNSKNFHV